MTILVVQHAPYEGPARLASLASEFGMELEVVHGYRGEAIPSSPGDALIILGGPMGVYEAAQHPYLVEEMELARAAVASGRPVLGICLGSQLLAAAHGAEVKPSGTQEIGFAEVTLSELATDDPLFAGVPRTFTPMHWHGDVFDLPRGAASLARSAMTTHQAFRLGARAWGLLFHLEVTTTWIDDCSRAFEPELRAASIDPSVLRAHAAGALAAVDAVSRTVLTRFLAFCAR